MSSEKVKPCLEGLVADLGEDMVGQILNKMVPLAIKCRTESDSGKDKAKFFECCERETENALNSLPGAQQAAFLKAKVCIKQLISSL